MKKISYFGLMVVFIMLIVPVFSFAQNTGTNAIAVENKVGEFQGLLKPVGVSTRQWGSHILSIQPKVLGGQSQQVGITYSVKASNDEVLNLLKKYEGQQVIIYGKTKYEQIEGGFWTLVAEKVSRSSTANVSIQIPTVVSSGATKESNSVMKSDSIIMNAPVSGKCPENNLKSEDGRECVKLSYGTATAIAPKEGIKEQASISSASLVPTNGACPEGYSVSSDGKECLKPSIIPKVIIAPRESNKGVTFESDGKVTIKDSNTNKETKIAPKEGFEATVSIESRTENQVPTVKEISVQSNINSDNKTITAGQVSVSTNEPIEVKENKMFLKKTEIKIMPDTASESAIVKLGDLGFKIELKDVGQGQDVKPSYEAKAAQDVKIFGLFKVKMSVRANVDAQTGEVSRLIKPWWSFLAK